MYVVGGVRCVRCVRRCVRCVRCVRNKLCGVVNNQIGASKPQSARDREEEGTGEEKEEIACVYSGQTYNGQTINFSALACEKEVQFCSDKFKVRAWGVDSTAVSPDCFHCSPLHLAANWENDLPQQCTVHFCKIHIQQLARPRALASATPSCGC